MGSFKWIAGFLGWVSGGPIGALIGFLLGSFFETGLDTMRRLSEGGYAPGGERRYGSTGSDWQQTNARTRGYTATEQRNSFLVSLLVLSAAVVKADGRILQSELNHVRAFIRTNFPEADENETMRALDELTRKQIDIYSVGGQIATYMNYSQRLQLFHYLAGIAQADGDFSKSEKDVLEAISAAIRLNRSDADSVIAMYYKDTESAYTVLEISPNATNDEVKAAYRRMAMKNHPDKVATLGPDVQKAAEEKFRKIQQAYETIKKQRGMR